MKPSKLIKLTIAFVLFAKPAAAFLSPSTLSMMAASIGSFVWGALVIVGVNFLLIYKKAKKKPIITSISISLILLLSISVVSYNNFKEIKELNEPYDDIALLKYEVEINDLDNLKEYNILSIETDVGNTLNLKDGSYNMDFDTLSYLFNNFSLFEKEFNLNKDEKYLVICERGHSSSKAAQIMNDNGYNASFARLARLTNYEFINEYFNLKKNPSSNLIIVPYTDEKNTVAFNFRFIPKHHDYAPEDTLSIDPEYFKPKVLEDKNIICLTNFHCLMTKYALDDAGINSLKIYKIPIERKEYMTMRQVDLILPE
jgi:rhodanese-related sulfurtransferase